MAQIVPAKVLDSCLTQDFTPGFVDVIELATGSSDENQVAVCARLILPAGENFKGELVQRDMAGLTALCAITTHGENFLLGIDIGPMKIEQLATSKSCVQ